MTDFTGYIMYQLSAAKEEIRLAAAFFNSDGDRDSLVAARKRVAEARIHLNEAQACLDSYLDSK